jgi:hypothetical protein
MPLKSALKNLGQQQPEQKRAQTPDREQILREKI